MNSPVLHTEHPSLFQEMDNFKYVDRCKTVSEGSSIKSKFIFSDNSLAKEDRIINSIENNKFLSPI